MPTRKTPAKRSLKVYQAKRNFQKTPEPSGAGKTKIARVSGKPGKGFFCVQKHLASHLHYDFRLEHEGVLLSWAVPKGPSLNPRDKRLAMRVEDHPLDYGDFEGVIPEGYGAGIVMLWDRGSWKPEALTSDVSKALTSGELKFSLEGTKLKGSWVLVRTGRSDEGLKGSESRTWLLIKHKDNWAGPIDVITAAPLSVKSFSDFPDILAADKPDLWQSNRPAKGGAAGEMLSQVIEQAAKLKAAKPKTRKRPSAKSKTR
jgi:bifunctional non-homologous end joining protein LigD